MAQEPIQIIQMEPSAPAAEELARVLGRSAQMELFPVQSVEEAQQVAQQFLPCVLLLSLLGYESEEALLAFLKKVEKPLRAGQLKVIAISTVKKNPIAPKLAALGVTDYVEEPVPLRALLFKANLAVKAVLALRKRARAGSADETVVIKSGDAEGRSGGQTLAVKPRYKEALKLGEDTFVFKHVAPKRHGRKLVLEAEGPEPDDGAWVAEDSKGRGGRKAWRWVPKKKDARQVGAAKDGWIHEGDEPEYDEKTGQWQFRSEKPSLVFRRHGAVEAVKVETDENGEVVIAEDSELALENLKKLRREAAGRRQQEMFDKRKKLLEDTELRDLRGEAEAPSTPEDPEDSALPEAKVPPAWNRARALGEEGEEGGAVRVGGGPEEDQEVNEAADANGDGSDGGSLALKTTPGAKEKATAARRSSGSGADEAPAHGDGISGADAEEQEKPIRVGEGEESPRSETQDLHTREESLEGLSAEDLESRRNLRDVLDGGVRDRRQGEAETPQAGRLSGEGEDAEEEEKRAREASGKAARARDGAGGRKAGAGRKERARRLEEMEREEQGDLAEEESDRQAAERDADDERARGTFGNSGREEASEKRRQRAAARAARAAARKLERARLEEEARAEAGGKVRRELGEEAPLGKVNLEDIEARERNFRAIESIEEGAGDVLWGEPEKKTDKKRPERSGSGRLDSVVLVPREELAPADGVWERAEKTWAFLSNQVFLDGFGELSELLPFWVYEDRAQPVLIPEGTHWRFLTQGPRLVERPEDIPEDVRELLENLQEQAALMSSDETNLEKLRKDAEDLPWMKERVTKGAAARAEVGDAPERSPEAPVDEASPHEEQSGTADAEARAEEGTSGPGNEGASAEEDAQPARGTVQVLEDEERVHGKVTVEELAARGEGGEVTLEEAPADDSGAVIADEALSPPADFRFSLQELLVFVRISDVMQSTLASDERRAALVAAVRDGTGLADVNWDGTGLTTGNTGERELYLLERYARHARAAFAA